MGNNQINKKELLREIEELSSPYMFELHNFIRYLKFKQSDRTASNDRLILQPENDPINHLIGFVEVTPISDTIDETLYGAV
jgi:hypothetical protein